jgi:PmbA protein
LKAVSVKDERFQGFLDPIRQGREGVFSTDILNLSTEDLVNAAKQLAENTRSAGENIMAQSECGVDWGGFAIGNSRGVQRASASATNYCQAYAMAIKGEERRSAYTYDVTRERLFDIKGIGEQATKEAVSLLGAKKLDITAEMPTLWIPKAAASYVLASLAQSANGRAVVEGISPISERIGDKIATSRFTVLDDGQNPASLGTQAVDHEGHPQGKTPIIQKGQLKHFLFDSYYGRAFKADPTGNCSRGGGPFGATLPFESSPGISSTSLEVVPGSKSEKELIASIDGKGVMIVDMPAGIFHSHVATGEFSAVAASVFLIENGEKRGAIQPVSVSGNFYKGLEQLLQVGSNLERTPWGVTIPSLVFDGFTIVG